MFRLLSLLYKTTTYTTNIGKDSYSAVLLIVRLTILRLSTKFIIRLVYTREERLPTNLSLRGISSLVYSKILISIFIYIESASFKRYKRYIRAYT